MHGDPVITVHLRGCLTGDPLVNKLRHFIERIGLLLPRLRIHDHHVEVAIIRPVTERLRPVDGLHPVRDSGVIDFQLGFAHRQPGRIVPVNLTEGIVIKVGASRVTVRHLDEFRHRILIRCVHNEVTRNLPGPQHGPKAAVFDWHNINGLPPVVLRLDIIGDLEVLTVRNIRSRLAHPV